tara:strand:- start:792 stop:1319 length:528 start_codon:yes stop_codon:yes gene_type:complete
MSKNKKRKKTSLIVDGHEYQIRYDLPLVRDIRKELGVHILTNEGVNEICGDVISFAEYLWHSVQSQAEKKGVDEEDFIRELIHCLSEAVDVWLEAICDFFVQMGRHALAELARALIETEREDRAEANRTVTRSTAEAVMNQQRKRSSAKRRKALAEYLADDEGDDNETPGASSDN